jgi:hypothetical protein
MVEASAPTAPLLDGRYLLEEQVGKGGMATVFRAQDIHLGRTVAVKMIRDEDAVDAAHRAHTEKALLASVSHPSLVTLFDAKLDPGHPQYLVMEFVHGPTLATRMASGPLATHEVAQIARDLAEALAAAHASGIVHRDVKPSNVLLAPPRNGGRWVAKLADFGIACSMDDPRVTTPGLMMGTLAYMAPEQLRDADPTPAVDVFSLGLVLLEALTGEHGYQAGGVASAVARLQSPPTIPDSVDPQWREVLERMTRLNPVERPSAREVAEAVRALPQKTSGLGRALYLPTDTDTDTPDPASAITDRTKPLPTAAATVTTPPLAAPGADAAASAVPPRARRRRALWTVGAVAVAGVLAVGASALVPTRADVARFAADGIARASLATASEQVDAATEVEEPAAPATTSSDPVTEETVAEVVTEQPEDLPSGPATKPDADTSGAAKPEQAGKPTKPDRAVTPEEPDPAGRPGKPDKSSD